MMAANKPKLQKHKLICMMKPLRECIQLKDGDISQCVPEVIEFEKTCNKKYKYVHDRDGLDKGSSGLYTGQKSL